MFRTVVLSLLALVFAATTLAVAQPKPKPPQRPPWQDVCCGGPCCAKPRVPSR